VLCNLDEGTQGSGNGNSDLSSSFFNTVADVSLHSGTPRIFSTEFQCGHPSLHILYTPTVQSEFFFRCKTLFHLCNSIRPPEVVMASYLQVAFHDLYNFDDLRRQAVDTLENKPPE